LRDLCCVTGKTILLIDMNAFNMAGLDDPLFHPMLNGFINWTRNQPVAPQAPATAEQTNSAKL
jgi:hypothetical protein